MKTVTVNRNVYHLTKQATEAFKRIHDEWELDICEKNPYDNLIGGRSTALCPTKHDNFYRFKP